MSAKTWGIRTIGEERGVALPVALFGLLAVSVLVTSALVTSSTEVALSSAHQQGTQAIYEADAALEQFVAQRSAMIASTDERMLAGGYQVAVPSGSQFTVSVAEMFKASPDPLPNGDVRRRETYSLVALPANGIGRAAGALIEITRMASSVSMNIDSGLTVGTNTTVTGSATISDGSSGGAACDSASAAAAILHSSDAEVTTQGGGHDIYGNIVEDERTSDELIEHILNGHSLDDFSGLAHIKFGSMFGESAFPISGNPTHTAANPKLRWGCPALLVAGCPATDAAYFPTVVIDANGGEVGISNYHGQGILVIRNGGLHISGGFKYGGIILVEGSLRISGGGAGSKKLEGAVIVMGEETIIDPGDESEVTGNSLIRYNECQIVDAQRGLTIASLDSSEQLIDTPTFAWFEVVR